MIEFIRFACLALIIVGVGGGWRRIAAANAQAASDPALKNDKTAKKAFLREKRGPTWRLILVGWIGIGLLILTFFFAP
ncbi:hypothetical protein JUM41_25330 [Rhizobium pusense]|uniref:hypothetical protein n=1 Tax=Agrobacterium pusense TaxID=648995 RepID=UPI001FCDDEB2|nr:hypothetical protein [Agrobacterium pusense]MCJ2877570.1 hypothetical protein [Agrobacterium pusense]